MRACRAAAHAYLVKPVSEWTGFLAICTENGLMSLSEDAEAAVANLAAISAYLAQLEDATLPVPAL